MESNSRSLCFLSVTEEFSKSADIIKAVDFVQEQIRKIRHQDTLMCLDASVTNDAVCQFPPALKDMCMRLTGIKPPPNTESKVRWSKKKL